jgi:hypothetical protein
MYLTFKKCVSLQTSKENNYLLSNCMPRINLQAINHVEGHTTQWPKRKRTEGQTTIYNTLHRKLKIEQHEPH